MINHIAIVGLGSIGRKHLRLVREFRPGIKITVVRSGEGKTVLEEKIANEISGSNGPVRLYFANYSKLFTLVQQHCQDCSADPSEIETMPQNEFIKELEHYMTYTLQPL